MSSNCYKTLKLHYKEPLLKRGTSNSILPPGKIRSLSYKSHNSVTEYDKETIKGSHKKKELLNSHYRT